jgi:DNA-binding IclR family transcriptional regulator
MFAILEALAQESDGLRLTEIGRRVGLHKSTVSRFLAAMEGRGYVEKVEARNVYRLGLRFVELSSIYLNKLELKTEAQPFMQRLATLSTQAVYLAIPDGAEVVYIDKVETFQSIRKYSIIGRRAPAYCTALGKALLADLAEQDVVELYRGRKLRAYTPKTITERDRLRRELDSVRRRGWTEDDEEYEPGVRCIAAPIYDYRSQAIAAVSTSGPTTVLVKPEVKRFAEYVMEAAAGISRRMGYRPAAAANHPARGSRRQ